MAKETEKSISESAALCWRPPEFQEVETLLNTVEEALRESERRYCILTESAADAILTIDTNMRLISASPSITRLLGYSVEEAMNRTMEDVFTSASFEIVTKAIAEEMTADKKDYKDLSTSRMLELDLIRKDGSLVPVEMKCSFLRDSSGQPLEILAIISDITERKQAVEHNRLYAESLLKAQKDTIRAMSMAVELRDPYTIGHQRRVAQLACAIARETNLTENQIDGLYLTGLVHDIGKVRVPAEILTNPNELAKAEFSVIKMHPSLGYDMLKNIEFPWPVAEAVLQHHERMNGSGYPVGLSGKDIVLEARILGVADVVEAMASRRAYRPSLGIENALQEISQNKGALYDIEVVDACFRVFTQKGFQFE